jgi:hypothetical protein
VSDGAFALIQSNPNPSQAEGRNPKIEKPGLKPGIQSKLWTAGALACDARVAQPPSAVALFYMNYRYQTLQTKDEYTLAPFLAAARKNLRPSA